MKIKKISVYEYQIGYAFGSYTMSQGRVQSHEPSLLVRLEADSGHIGWGETCPHGRTYIPGFFEGEREALSILAPALLGVDPRQTNFVNTIMDQEMLAGHGAKSALDAACLDIAGKAAQVPVATLLGGVVQNEFQMFEAIPVGSPQKMADYAIDAQKRGCTAFQVKVGDNPLDDVARVNAVRNATAPGTTLIADANGGWTPQSALVAARHLLHLEVFLEQPCKTLNDCCKVRDILPIPLILDECILTVDDLVRGKQMGATGVNIKPSRVGGLSKARVLRDTAVGLGMMVTVDDTWGGSVVTAMSCHFAASTPKRNLLAAALMSEWTTPALSEHLYQPKNGLAHMKFEPGLGALVDEAKIGKALLEVS